VTGDWQKFKGLAAPEPMRVAPPAANKRALFDAALAETSGDALGAATTPRKRVAAKADTSAPGASGAGSDDAAAG
jgi:small subunit ribosomal protein S16